MHKIEVREPAIPEPERAVVWDVGAEISGPPAYFTPDWVAARRSVEQLVALEPLKVATGHGPPLEGEEMLEDLRRLARNFDRVAVPRRGRYVRQPAVMDERGVVAIPPPVTDPLPRVLLGLSVALLASALLSRPSRRG